MCILLILHLCVIYSDLFMIYLIIVYYLWLLMKKYQ